MMHVLIPGLASDLFEKILSTRLRDPNDPTLIALVEREADILHPGRFGSIASEQFKQRVESLGRYKLRMEELFKERHDIHGRFTKAGLTLDDYKTLTGRLCEINTEIDALKKTIDAVII